MSDNPPDVFGFARRALAVPSQCVVAATASAESMAVYVRYGTAADLAQIARSLLEHAEERLEGEEWNPDLLRDVQRALSYLPNMLQDDNAEEDARG